MSDKLKQIGVIRISYELLAELMGLSDDHEVINLFHEEKERKTQTVGVVVKGPKMPYNAEGYDLCWTWEVPQQDGTLKDIRDLRCLIKTNS